VVRRAESVQHGGEHRRDFLGRDLLGGLELRGDVCGLVGLRLWRLLARDRLVRLGLRLGGRAGWLRLIRRSGFGVRGRELPLRLGLGGGLPATTEQSREEAATRFDLRLGLGRRLGFRPRLRLGIDGRLGLGFRGRL
jgi:hypothetical protein